MWITLKKYLVVGISFLLQYQVGSRGFYTAPVTNTTWFVRSDGGTIYNATDAPTGQCDGKGDAAYPGSGVNQHCAVFSPMYLWMDGAYSNFNWIISGGDTVVIRSCAPFPSEQNPAPPACRIGLTTATGGGICQGPNPFGYCDMPPPPNGTAAHPTKILGGCAYGTYTCNPVNTYPYTSNLTQLFGGFDSPLVIDLSGSSYVDIEGLELTSHNGACTNHGYPQYPGTCSTSHPYSDFANVGIQTSNTSSNILLQDLYIHGFTSDGIGGPLGGPFTLTRVSLDFNAFAGWNFDNGTMNASTATLTQSYVTMIGNGCLEQYPIVNTQFPALSCWDSNSGGFGDSWSGQASLLNTFTCDHCVIEYNTKDGGIGPHTDLLYLSLTNSIWVGNMGQQWKWGMQPNSTTLIQNNLVLGNCMRMSQILPGAAQSFDIGTGFNGSYLSLYCRAAGTMADYFADLNSTVLFANNTFVTYSPTVFDFGCATTLPAVCNPYVLTDNIVLGYTTNYTSAPFNPFQAPGLYYFDVSSATVAVDHMVEFGIRNGDICTGSIQCTDPLFYNEPSQTWVSEATLDCYSGSTGSCFYLNNTSSPPWETGASYTGQPATFFDSTSQTSPRTIGALGHH